MEKSDLEEFLEKVEDTRRVVEKLAPEIENPILPLDEKKYKKLWDNMNYSMQKLNCYQNQVLIEQNQEIIKYLKEMKK